MARSYALCMHDDGCRNLRFASVATLPSNSCRGSCSSEIHGFTVKELLFQWNARWNPNHFFGKQLRQSLWYSQFHLQLACSENASPCDVRLSYGCSAWTISSEQFLISISTAGQKQLLQQKWSKRIPWFQRCEEWPAMLDCICQNISHILSWFFKTTFVNYSHTEPRATRCSDILLRG